MQIRPCLSNRSASDSSQTTPQEQTNNIYYYYYYYKTKIALLKMKYKLILGQILLLHF